MESNPNFKLYTKINVKKEFEYQIKWDLMILLNAVMEIKNLRAFSKIYTHISKSYGKYTPYGKYYKEFFQL